MAYKVIILYQLYMPSYFLGTFTEYPSLENIKLIDKEVNKIMPPIKILAFFLIFIFVD